MMMKKNCFCANTVVQKGYMNVAWKKVINLYVMTVNHRHRNDANYSMNPMNQWNAMNWMDQNIQLLMIEITSIIIFQSMIVSRSMALKIISWEIRPNPHGILQVIKGNEMLISKIMIRCPDAHNFRMDSIKGEQISCHYVIELNLKCCVEIFII